MKFGDYENFSIRFKIGERKIGDYAIRTECLTESYEITFETPIRILLSQRCFIDARFTAKNVNSNYIKRKVRVESVCLKFHKSYTPSLFEGFYYKLAP